MLMEYQHLVKSALKSCVLRDTDTFVQSQNQTLSEEGFGADDGFFPVDDLLIDFADEGGEGDGEGAVKEKEEEEEEEDGGSAASYDHGVVFDDDDDRNSDLITFSSQLAVPDDDLAELERVSHFFFDDSLHESPVLYPITPAGLEPGSMNRSSEPVRVEHPPFPSHVPVKARSKRPRIARRENPSPSDSSGNSSGSCLSFAGGALSFSSGNSFGFGQDEPVRKRKKSNRPVGTGVLPFPRRCTHCQVQRTPQWRSGPLGPKTLCNACGVRFKSGRLLPEYRPACSPTFSNEIHSNSHRKVVEMRRNRLGSGGLLEPECLVFDRV